METSLLLLLLLRNLLFGFVSLSSSACFHLTLSSSSSSPLTFGIHPIDEKYFASEVIKCKDGSNFFTRDRINDNFCDCPDGSDEPGTSACPAGKFYCRNAGSTPRFLFSSRVNDQICDCCDGSDEYDGNINCPNTCFMGGNVAYRRIQYGEKIRNPGSIDTKIVLHRLDVADSVQKLKGLKLVIIIQVFFIIVVVGFGYFIGVSDPEEDNLVERWGFGYLIGVSGLEEDNLVDQYYHDSLPDLGRFLLL